MNEVKEDLMVVYMTYEYDKFDFFPTNRTPDHVEKIKESIRRKDLTALCPIIVNENFLIVDGQNRYLACKELGIPVYYFMQDGLTEEDVIILNTGNKNWNQLDYCRYYSKRGNKSYEIMEKAVDNLNVPLSVVMVFGKHNEETNSFALKHGYMKFSEKEYEMLAYASRMFRKLEKVTDKTLPKSKILFGMASFILKYKIKEADLKSSIEKYGYKFRLTESREEYVEIIKDIYNHNRRSGRLK